MQEAIDFAKANGLTSVEVDGIKFEVPRVAVPEGQTEASEEEIRKLLDTFEEYTEEEILYFATPYFDELQERKKLREKHLAEKADLDGEKVG